MAINIKERPIVEAQPGMAAVVNNLISDTVRNPAVAIKTRAPVPINTRMATSSKCTAMALNPWASKFTKFI